MKGLMDNDGLILQFSWFYVKIDANRLCGNKAIIMWHSQGLVYQILANDHQNKKLRNNRNL